MKNVDAKDYVIYKVWDKEPNETWFEIFLRKEGVFLMNNDANSRISVYEIIRNYFRGYPSVLITKKKNAIKIHADDLGAMISENGWKVEKF